MRSDIRSFRGYVPRYAQYIATGKSTVHTPPRPTGLDARLQHDASTVRLAWQVTFFHMRQIFTSVDVPSLEAEANRQANGCSAFAWYGLAIFVRLGSSPCIESGSHATLSRAALPHDACGFEVFLIHSIHRPTKSTVNRDYQSIRCCGE